MQISSMTHHLEPTPEFYFCFNHNLSTFWVPKDLITSEWILSRMIGLDRVILNPKTVSYTRFMLKALAISKQYSLEDVKRRMFEIAREWKWKRNEVMILNVEWSNYISNQHCFALISSIIHVVRNCKLHTWQDSPSCYSHSDLTTLGSKGSFLHYH